MSINHHLLAKTATDAILSKFKLGEWTCYKGIGAGFYRIGCDSTFPSPDAAFFEDANKVLTSFEFKPPTENKRGILTGLGQTIAYLDASNQSYLIIPEKLDDFPMGRYMTDLFQNHIVGNLPIGLIAYDNNDASKVSLVHNVAEITNEGKFKSAPIGRFWAKHQDLPIPLFHWILHCYYLKKVGSVTGDAFAHCFSKYLVPNSVFTTMQSVVVKDTSGLPIKTPAGHGNISFFKDKLARARNLEGAAQALKLIELKRDASTKVSGDNYYQSTRKNFVTFLKHVGTIDSEGNLTNEGFKLYNLGLINGPTSKLFTDYFAKTLLLTGHHLDVIFDLDNLFNQHKGEKTVDEIKGLWLDEYDAKGMIKHNPQRVAGAEVTVGVLKFEFIIWKALGLFLETPGRLPEKSFNWKRITEVCSLPAL